MKEEFGKKFHTPIVFQVFITILLIAVPVLLEVLYPLWRTKLDGRIYIYHILKYFLKLSNPMINVIRIVFVATAVVGIIFVWINRPAFALIETGLDFLLMLLSSILVSRRQDAEFLDGSFIVWATIIALIVFVILAIILTKPGPRSPKTVAIAEPAKPELSPADEIKKYKELLDAGAITQEEFDMKKKQLLGL